MRENFVFPRIFWNVCRSFKLFVKKSYKSQKFKMTIYWLNENLKKSEKCFCIRFIAFSIFWDQKLKGQLQGRSASRPLVKARYLQLVRNLPLNFGNIIFISFRSRYDVKLLLRLKNKFFKLLNIKCKLSVFYYIVEVF